MAGVNSPPSGVGSKSSFRSQIYDMYTIHKETLDDICNTSFASDIFPDRLKIAKVKTLCKKGNTGEAQNY